MQGAILHDTDAGLKTRPRTTVYYSNSASQATSGTKCAIILKVPVNSKRKTIGTH